MLLWLFLCPCFSVFLSSPNVHVLALVSCAQVGRTVSLLSPPFRALADGWNVGFLEILVLMGLLFYCAHWAEMF